MIMGIIQVTKSLNLFFFIFLTMLTVHKCHDIMRPNIVFLVGDDIGWNDFSLHGSNQIMTPNIDMIGHQGIVIQNYYTDSQGTAARSAMFTGKYPLRMGTQGSSIGGAEDRGIPVSEKLLPSYLQDLGYSTHLVGKWALGKSRECYLPIFRGFDTFYGSLGSSVDYVTYNHLESCNNSQFYGLDLFNNLEPVLDRKAEHLTDVLTDQAIQVIKKRNASRPLYLHVAHAAANAEEGLLNSQASASTLIANDHIAHPARRSYAALLAHIDQSVGKIISALAENEMLNNTLIIFVSNNGAAATGKHQNFGSNLPLRGTKGTPWEGGVRSMAVLWHNDMKHKIWKGIFHVCDWMPTLISAAGGNTIKGLDGFNQWNALNGSNEPPRTETIIAVDDVKGWGALRDGDLKIVVGNVDEYVSDYYGKGLGKLRHETSSYEHTLEDSETAAVFREILGLRLNHSKAMQTRHACDLYRQKKKGNNTLPCLPTKTKGCLFNITADPTETNDLWYKKPKDAMEMTLRFRLLWPQIMPRQPSSCDVRADPSLHGFIWFPWLDNNEPAPEPLINTHEYPLQVTTEEYQYYVNWNLDIMKDKLNNCVKTLTNSFIESLSGLLSKS